MAAPSRRNSGFDTTANVGVGTGLADDAFNLITAADRDGRLGDDHGEARQKRRHLLGDRKHIGEVGAAVTRARRRADRDEYGVRFGDRGGEVGGEMQPAAAHIAGDQVAQPQFKDRNFAAPEPGDLVRVLVDAGDGVAEVGKAGPGHEADIAAADHGKSHDNSNVSETAINPEANAAAIQRVKLSDKIEVVKLNYRLGRGRVGRPCEEV